MSSNRPNLTLDERAFEGLLSAAFTIQEHNDRQKQAQPSAVTEAEVSTLCRHCGALKPSVTSPCGTCGLEEFRPGERLQRNWASMWLRSQYQEWPEHPTEAGVEVYSRRFADTTKDMAAENVRLAAQPAFGSVRDDSSLSEATQTHTAMTDTAITHMAMNDASLVGASTPLSLTADASPSAKFQSTFSALESTFEAKFESTFEANLEANVDPHFDPVIAAADALPVSLFHRLSDWR